MNEHKFTDEEIIAGLEQCIVSITVDACEGCPFDDFCNEDVYILEKEALGLIRRQKAEIERLERHTKMHDEIQAEAIKEFADRLKAKAKMGRGYYGNVYHTVSVNDITSLVNEMTEDAK